MSLRKSLRGRDVPYEQRSTGRRTHQRTVFLTLPTIEEASNQPVVVSTSSDSHLAYESSPEGEDSESGMVLLTTPSQRSSAPASTAPGSPTPKVSRSSSGSPTPSVPTSLSTSFSNFSPVLPSKEQDASPTESLQTPGDQTPGTQPHPLSPLSTHAQKRANIQQCWRSPQPSPTATHIVVSAKLAPVHLCTCWQVLDFFEDIVPVPCDILKGWRVSFLLVGGSLSLGVWNACAIRFLPYCLRFYGVPFVSKLLN